MGSNKGLVYQKNIITITIKIPENLPIYFNLPNTARGLCLGTKMNSLVKPDYSISNDYEMCTLGLLLLCSFRPDVLRLG